jgi:GWxTD domain-containing protein
MPSSAVRLLLAAALAMRAAEGGPLTPRQAHFLEQEVHFLISTGERAQFEALASDEERDSFIERFWARRDPTPGTPENEAREEHDRRLLESDRRFGSDAARGRFSERGRILQLLGEPAFRESFSAAGSRLVPIDLWHYAGLTLPWLPDSFYLVFFRPLGDARYRLWDPASDGLRALVPEAEPGRMELSSGVPEIERVDPELGLAVERLVEGSPSGSGGLLATLEALPDLLARRRVDEVASVRSGASFERLPVRIEAAVVDDDALVPELHYALELPPEGDASLHWRTPASSAGGRRSRFTLAGRLVGDEGELDRWEDEIELEELPGAPGDVRAITLSFQGRRLLPRGARRLELTLVDEGRASGFASVVPHRLVLARSLSSVRTALPGLPFRFGGRLLSPLAGELIRRPALAVLPLTEPMGEVVWELARLRPDDGGSDVLWSERQPIEGPLATVALPLEGRPEGRYRVRASYPRGVEERSFFWRPAGSEPPEAVRVLARERTPAEESLYRRRRASAFAHEGDRERAIEEMQGAVSRTPGAEGLQLELAALRYSARRYSEVVDQLEPLRFERVSEIDRLVLLAASSEALGRFDLAVVLYERALALEPNDARLHESLARARDHAPGR